MLAQRGTLAFLISAVAGWSSTSDGIVLPAQSRENDRTAIEVVAMLAADGEMDVGRYYLGKRDYVGAINRFKRVVTQYPTSWDVEEALAHVSEAYLGLGIRFEAQTAVAVLGRKFPNRRWSLEAQSVLKSAGFDPVEDEKSWIAKALK